MNEQQIQIIPQYSQSEYNEFISEVLQEISPKFNDVTERIFLASRYFLNRPYQHDVCGEGVAGHFDQNPIFRTDVFDSTSLINTILAVALSKDLYEFRQVIFNLNYFQSIPCYANRFHFTCVDWNTENLKKGLLFNLTNKLKIQLTKGASRVARTMIDRPNWFRHRRFEDIRLIQEVSSAKENMLLRQMHSFAKSQLVVQSCIPYLPLPEMFECYKSDPTLLDAVPCGSIVQIVRPNWNLREKIGTNVNISHMGFLFKKKKYHLLYYACEQRRRVIEVPFWDYLRDICLPSPTIQGINILGVIPCLQDF